MSLIFFKNPYGGHLYLNPEVLTPLYLITFIINITLEIGWLFLWDRQLIVWAAVDLVLVGVTGVASGLVLARNLAGNDNVLKRQQPKLYW